MYSDISPSLFLHLIADEVHRHGKKRPGADRIIKVPFRITADRDSFIRSFNALVTGISDLIVSELPVGVT